MSDCSLITEQRMNGMGCRSFNCVPCREFKQQNDEYLNNKKDKEGLALHFDLSLKENDRLLVVIKDLQSKLSQSVERGNKMLGVFDRILNEHYKVHTIERDVEECLKQITEQKESE